MLLKLSRKYCYCALFFTLLGYTSVVWGQSPQLDNLFLSGSGFNGIVYAVELQQDGKIVIGGAFTTYNGQTANRLIRLNPNGTIDSLFQLGTGFSSTVRDLKLDAQNRIIVVGNFTSVNGVSRSRIVRLNTNGSVDTSFNVGAGLNREAFTIELLSNNRIAVGGSFDSYRGSVSGKLAVILPNGDVDPSFVVGSGFSPSSTFKRINAIQEDQNNKLIVAGDFDDYNGTTGLQDIARLNPNGTLDNTFLIGTGANAAIHDIIIQPDNKILLCGLFNQFNGQSTSRLVRLNDNGTNDPSFSTGTGFINPTGLSSSTNYRLKYTFNQKIIVGGSFAGYGGVVSGKLVVLNSDGSIFQSFQPGYASTMDYVSDVELDQQGHLIVSGSYTGYNASQANRISRLLTGFPVSGPGGTPGFDWDCVRLDSIVGSPSLSSTSQVLAIDFEPRGKIGYAAGTAGTLIKSVNNGVSWSSINTLFSSSYRIEEVYTSDSLRVLVMGSDSAAGSIGYYSLNAGSTWNLASITGALGYAIRQASFPRNDLGFAIATNTMGDSRLFRTIDGGIMWDSVRTFPSQSFVSISFVNDSVGYLSSSNGAVLKTINGGLAWSTLVTPFSQLNLEAISFAHGDTGFLAVNTSTQSLVYKTVNGGNSWDTSLVAHVNPVNRIVHKSNYVFATAGNTLFVSDNNGLTWINTSTPGSFVFEDVHYLGNDTAIVAGGQMFAFATEGFKTRLSTFNDTVCANSNAVLRASTTSGQLLWFEDSLLSRPIGNLGDTSIQLFGVNQDDTLYVLATNGQCSSLVEKVYLRVLPTPDVNNVVVSVPLVCYEGDALITLTGFGSLMPRFYADSSRSQPLNASATGILSIESLTSNQVVYFTVANSTCESNVRAVSVLVRPPITAAILVSNDTLIAPVFSTYQWINCTTGLPITGEVNRKFRPIENGIYSVIVGDAQCSDTLACVSFSSVGVPNNETFSSSVRVFPNPADNYLIIKAETQLLGDETIEIFDARGQLLRAFLFHSLNEGRISLEEFPSGLYYLRIVSKQRVKSLLFQKH